MTDGCAVLGNRVRRGDPLSPFLRGRTERPTNVKGITTCESSHQGLRKFAVLTAVGGAMLLGSISAASAASTSAAAPAPNASAISDAHGLRVTGLGGPN